MKCESLEPKRLIDMRPNWADIRERLESILTTLILMETKGRTVGQIDIHIDTDSSRQSE